MSTMDSHVCGRDIGADCGYDDCDRPEPTPPYLALCDFAQTRLVTAQWDRRQAAQTAIENGCTYRQIAEAMGLTVASVHNIVNGRNR